MFFQILCHSSGYFGIIPHTAKGRIAMTAEDIPDLVCIVAMIYDDPL
jgi:hypothetical protein